MKKLIWLLLPFAFMACDLEDFQSEQSSTGNSTKRVQTGKKAPAVCIWDGASVRQGPSANARWLAGLSLGEKVTYLGITTSDSTDTTRNYHKIEMSDGTVGWSSEYTVAVDAEPSVAIKRTPIFRRPNLLTMTSEEFDPMEMLAIVEADSEWIRVVGRQNKKKGWVKLTAVSMRPEDVAVGVLSRKALELQETEDMADKLELILENPAFSGSVFINELDEMYRDARRGERD